MNSASGRLALRSIAPLAHGAGEGVRHVGFELAAILMLAGFFAFLGWGMQEITLPASSVLDAKISLLPSALPEYMLRTTLRMLLAVIASLLFTLVYATLAAKSRRLGQILVPLLDILQSVPVLGYISFTVTGFLALFPNSALGIECASIFAIFTSQAWNMTFSFYQSLTTIPGDMEEASVMLGLSPWQKFWRLEWPFAIPGLVWNMMMSMSGGWFFVVASEAITVGNNHIMLPGIGSYIALAIERQDMHAIFWAIGAMFLVILAYDQFLFRPLVAWSDKFTYDLTAHQSMPHSWVLTLLGKSRVIRHLIKPLGKLMHRAVVSRFGRRREARTASLPANGQAGKALDYLWYLLLFVTAMMGLWQASLFFRHFITLSDVREVARDTMFTFLRVIVLLFVASLIWVPISVWIGLRPKATAIMQPIAQFLAAFPANLLFPLAVILIYRYHLNPDWWLSPLIILGTQWYIVFNVIAGASAFPGDMREAAQNLGVKGWLWWRRVMLPGIFPYFLTGAITASGGSWNASIAAELVSWGPRSYQAKGIGSYIAERTKAGDLPHTALGVGMMALVVTLLNKFFWRRLYDLASRRLRWD
jgi:NitT/TauT family transport system permease protein